VIQDLDGAAIEPSRRSHVAALSAGVAAVSLVLLMALVVPAPRTETRPLAAAPAPSPTDGTVVTFASGSTWIRLPDRPQISEVRGVTPPGDVTSTECAVIGSSQPFVLVFDRNGQPIAAYTSGRTGRFNPLPQAYVGSGWLSIPCDPSDVFAPRINRAR